MRRHHLADDNEQGRADERAEDRPGSADDGPYHPFARDFVEHVSRGAVPAEEGEQRAGHSGKKARHDERSQPDEVYVDADERGADVVIADSKKGFAQGAADDSVDQIEAKADGYQNE